jgi:spermidine synthase
MDVTFVDTSPAIERFMGKFLKRPPVWLHQNQLLLADAKEYLQTCPQTHFDIVLAVHMIFHILKQDWGIFFTQGMRSLRKGGTLIVGIRSWEAQFWQMFDPIMKEVEEKMNGRTMQFAHDIAEALRHAGLMTTRTSNEFHLDVPHESALIRVIEFLYRLPYGTVANSSQWRERIMAVANLQKHQFGSYRFAMTDDLFAIRKMQPLDNLTETSFLSGDLELNPWVH